jgi:malonate decarboxylase beta subunit
MTRRSYYESTARQRIDGVFDRASFRELVPPSERTVSPHLPALDLPVALDDGVIIGTATLDARPVLVAAQEGGFMGGAVGEVHGAKIAGLLRRALRERPDAVLLLLDSGGVRLQEAGAGLTGVSEIIAAIVAARAARVAVVAAIGGTCGCFGGMGIAAACCDVVVMSEEGRLGLSGPEVIETLAGAEELDARDRALVWRTCGGKHRYLLGDCDVLVDDSLAAFREALAGALGRQAPLTLEALEREHAMLQRRIARFGGADDAQAIWQALGIERPEEVPLTPTQRFVAQVRAARERSDAPAHAEAP